MNVQGHGRQARRVDLQKKIISDREWGKHEPLVDVRRMYSYEILFFFIIDPFEQILLSVCEAVVEQSSASD